MFKTGSSQVQNSISTRYISIPGKLVWLLFVIIVCPDDDCTFAGQHVVRKQALSFQQSIVYYWILKSPVLKKGVWLYKIFSVTILDTMLYETYDFKLLMFSSTRRHAMAPAVRRRHFTVKEQALTPGQYM
jgi:hypothetical protein